MDNPTIIFEKLMTRDKLSGLGIKKQLDRIALLIDLSGDLEREDGTARSLAWCDDIESQTLTHQQRALIEYFRANLVKSAEG
jgi:hypothetical protein